MRFALFLLSAAVCCACMCIGPSPSPLDEWRSSDLVFLGTVIRVDPLADAQAVHIAISEGFKGIGDRREFVLHQQAGGCNRQFQSGERVLFYLSSTRDGSIYTRPCGPTRRAMYAEADLAFLRTLPHSANSNRLYGIVDLYAETPADGSERVRPLEGIELTITGATRVLKTSTNVNGLYALSGIPPGKYDVTIALPPTLKVKFKNTNAGFLANRAAHESISLDANSHVGVSFALEEDTLISGRVLGPSGAPLAGVRVVLEALKGKVNIPRNFSWTEADGKYELTKMLSGSYRVTVERGIAAEAQSQLVTVRAGTPLKGIDFRIPKLTPRVTLAGGVNHVDGRPAKGARVLLGDSKSAYTNATGEFRIVTEPTETAFIVADNPDCSDVTSIPLAITPNKNLANIILTVPPCK